MFAVVDDLATIVARGTIFLPLGAEEKPQQAHHAATVGAALLFHWTRPNNPLAILQLQYHGIDQGLRVED